MSKPGQIITQAVGMGVKWYCTNCDQYHNGHIWTIRWTNSTPPKQCEKCGSRTELQQQAQEAKHQLLKIYGQRAVFPGDEATIARLLDSNYITGKYDSMLVARTINSL
jgi:hypothetical protein